LNGREQKRVNRKREDRKGRTEKSEQKRVSRRERTEKSELREQTEERGQRNGCRLTTPAAQKK